MVPVAILEAVWLQTAVVLPLLFHTLSYRVFEPEKTVVLRLLAVVAAVPLVMSLLSARSRGALAWGRLRSPAGVLVGVLLVWACVSSALSLDPWQSLLGSYHRQGGLVTLAASVTLFAAVAVGLRSQRELRRLLSAIALAGVAASAYAIAQRAGLDPIVWDAAGWGGDPLVRTPGSLGNPTFLAGFLALTLFATVATGRSGPVTIALLAVQAAGLWAAGSRGALVGVAAGALMLVSAYAAATRRRWITVATGSVAACATVAILLLNLAGSPLAAARDAGPWRAVAHLWDATDSTARVRVLLWESSYTLMTRDAPLEMVGGHTDRFDGVRPLAGYGPETLASAISREYPAELARLERPDAVLDRSHNDVVDAWTSGGAVGVAVTVLLYIAVLLAGCRALSLGRVTERGCAAGGIAGALLAAAAALLAGRPWLAAPAVAVGAIGGVAAVLLAAGARRGASVAPTSAMMPAMSLMGALAAHIIDVQTGIATVAPRTTFWLLAGCTVALAGRTRSLEALDSAPDANAGDASRPWVAWAPVVTLGFALSPAMITTAAAWRGGAVLGAIAAIVIAAAWALALVQPRQVWRGGVVAAFLVTALVGAVWWVSAGDTDTRDVVARVSRLAWPILLAMVVMVTVLAMQRRVWWREQRTVTIVALGAAAIAIWPVLAPVRADVLVRAGRQLEVRGYPAAAIPLHEAASRLMPHETQYRVAAAGSAQLAAAQQTDPRLRDALFERAAAWLATDLSREADLQRTFAAARLQYAWAATSTDAGDRVRRGAQANAYYERLTALSPGNPLYWNDWASLALDVFRNASVARSRLQRSRALDPLREDTQRLLEEATRRLAAGS